jgi:hypothetical protein
VQLNLATAEKEKKVTPTLTVTAFPTESWLWITRSLPLLQFTTNARKVGLPAGEELQTVKSSALWSLVPAVQRNLLPPSSE